MDLKDGVGAEEKRDSLVASPQSDRIDGYLYKLEQRPIVGQMRKKYWFVLPSGSPVLYWFKNVDDFNCAGRILLSGAAFIYNPRENGIFEIHVDNKCYLLEAPSNRSRLDWLSALRQSRRQYYSQRNTPKSDEEAAMGVERSTTRSSTAASTSMAAAPQLAEGGPSTSKSAAVVVAEKGDPPVMELNLADLYVDDPPNRVPTDESIISSGSEHQTENRSVFYLSEEGELHPGSLEVPPPILIHSVCDTVEQKIDDLINRSAEETQQLEMATKRLLNKARSSIRTLSQTSHPIPINPQPREDCDRCQELAQSIEQLRNRCYELTDDLVGHQELVRTLKRNIVAAHNQRDALKRYCMDSSTDAEKMDFILERESALAKMQFTISELRRDIEALREENRHLETENSSLSITVEAFQESVRTKEELILKYADQQCGKDCGDADSAGGDANNVSAANARLLKPTAAIPIVGKTSPPPPQQQQKHSKSLTRKRRTSSSAAGMSAANGNNAAKLPISAHQLGASSAEPTEALLVDFGTPTDVAAKTVFAETVVNDLNEMKDVIDGYRNQNKFLNHEVLELQKIVQALEDRERRLIRQNFNIEAVYYQLKSRYIMLLNHFRPQSADRPRRTVESSLIQELIDEVSRPRSPMRTHNATSLAVETAKSSSALATLVACPKKAIAAYDDTDGSRVLCHRDPETDSLGFYLGSPRTRKAVAEFFSNANKKEAKREKADIGEEEEESDEDEASDDDDEMGRDQRSSPSAEEKEKQNAKHKKEHSSQSLSDELVISRRASTAGGKMTSTTTQTDESSSSAAPAAGPASAPSTSNCSFKSSALAYNNVPALKQDDLLLWLASGMKKRSDDIISSIEIGNNQELVEWLQRWDAFLVNQVAKPLNPNPQLKALIRCGIPHTYRTRVWNSLVNFLVAPVQSETGKGYYDCLLQKAHRIRAHGGNCTFEEDSALKQIDLDLIRTLPNNKLFEAEHSPKVSSLKNILYAFRFHNKMIYKVEYCQGLNRLGAIGLLYLDEPQAFWFLVACVDHLQPLHYYSSSLMGAVIDQRVLMDLVQDKMPVLHAHLARLDVDLSLFTLSWFLTVFVDTLSHNVYIKIFDVFLLEGNKVLFRFALALLKLAEPRILECTSLSGVQHCLSSLSTLVTDFKALAHVAFNWLNPFPARSIESRRQGYYTQYKCGKLKS